MPRILTKEEWYRRKRRNKFMVLLSVILLLLLILMVVVFYMMKAFSGPSDTNEYDMETIATSLSNGEAIKLDYLTPNEYSRPQTELKKVNGIVIHYTANPGTSAENNRNYFESLKWKQTTSASSHFIIGLGGEILQCIPLNEISYASNDRNRDTISIECCHEDATGVFNEKTYASLVSLTAALCSEYDLDQEDVIRHYDVTGKRCPLYYVDNEDAWITFREDMAAEINDLSLAKTDADKH